MTTLAFVAAFCVVAVLVYMARYSGRLRGSHTRVIDAPLAEIYARVVDLRQWADWNPWLEPEAGGLEFAAPDAGAARNSFRWSYAGVDAGEIELAETRAPGRIEQRMRLKRPFRFRARGSWQFSEADGGTRATWSVRGRVAFSMRAFAATVQGALALDLRYGLDRLAALVESADAPRYAISCPGVREIDSIRYAYILHSGPLGGLGKALHDAVAELRRTLASRDVAATAEPIAVYVRTNIKRRTTVCHLGIPIGAAAVDGVSVAVLPAHRAFVARLDGSPAQIEVAWYLAMRRVSAESLQPDLRITPFERYLTAFDGTREEGSVIELYIPVRIAT